MDWGGRTAERSRTLRKKKRGGRSARLAECAEFL
jgi:hypothetical protein